MEKREIPLCYIEELDINGQPVGRVALQFQLQVIDDSGKMIVNQKDQRDVDYAEYQKLHADFVPHAAAENQKLNQQIAGLQDHIVELRAVIASLRQEIGEEIGAHNATKEALVKSMAVVDTLPTLFAAITEVKKPYAHVVKEA